MENANVAVEAPEGFDVLFSIPCPKLEYNVQGTCYVALSLPESVLSSTGNVLFLLLIQMISSTADVF